MAAAPAIMGRNGVAGAVTPGVTGPSRRHKGMTLDHTHARPYSSAQSVNRRL